MEEHGGTLYITSESEIWISHHISAHTFKSNGHELMAIPPCSVCEVLCFSFLSLENFDIAPQTAETALANRGLLQKLAGPK